ncbi:hypothetical protein RS130_18850 [Paraglaciecola aquimarina]|uniref:Energy transducer TonB n=1 Tax=Paraglaciecola aquimarina TaxID=1235557 RepID=A0ABU3T072_9ALTE|nr:hypothetical protein [Paraglaciecola aquimarina]MDU0355665.1 hypothetical protein [Paraglaciecola aquimarina]
MTRIIAIVSALGLITLLMCLVITLQETELLTPEKTMVREINLAVPPPPPPPPPANQQAQFDAAPSLELNVDGAGPEIQFAQVELAGKTELANLPLPEMS